MAGYLYDKPAAMAAFRLAARISQAAGKLTSITLSDSFCVERHRDEFLGLIRNSIDIVFANETEIKAMYKTQSFSGAIDAARNDCPIVVVTRSDKGSVIIKGENTIEVPAHPVKSVVDVTGAGDLYAAGFLFGYTAGIPLAHCARLASLAASEVISHVGARPEVNLGVFAREQGLI
jgi:sugar/nucleoside kinase (ribokinase family)